MRTIGFIAIYMILALSIAVFADVCTPGAQSTENRVAPALQIQGLTGTSFDNTYMRVMYQHHSDTAALAQVERDNTNSTVLRNLSDKIIRERNNLNKKLAEWYRRGGGGELSELCYTPPRSWLQTAGLASDQFDNRFVQLMLTQLQQARDAAQLAVSNATMPDLRNQANLIVKISEREIDALQRWQQNLPTED